MDEEIKSKQKLHRFSRSILDSVCTLAPSIVYSGTAREWRIGPSIGQLDIGISDDAYFFRVSLPGVEKDAAAQSRLLALKIPFHPPIDISMLTQVWFMSTQKWQNPFSPSSLANPPILQTQKREAEENKVESIKRDKAAIENFLQETIEKHQVELAGQKEHYTNALSAAKEVKHWAVFREEMLRRDIGDLQNRYQRLDLNSIHFLNGNRRQQPGGQMLGLVLNGPSILAFRFEISRE
ncbi:hypothetical protein IFM89_025456 [Coptis chinensis]|uniref:SHSP domain-containing protein n=1 Tax=Coptis chinensis TaxID=261450 RepID=A0A835IYA0_9MAGN|nr:hypothetical protein IFM89_025456 [Coptis chinensis]